MENEPEYTIQTEFRGDHLWALVGGERLTATIAARYWDEIASRCKENDCRKILIEKDFEVPARAQDLIEMAEHLSTVLPGSCIAFIDRWNHEGINELGKRLARNHDVKMQTFSTLREAEKWLRAN